MPLRSSSSPPSTAFGPQECSPYSDNATTGADLSYVDTGTRAATLLDTLSHPSPNIIGVDTEGASFHRFVDRIYLLQLSTRSLSAIIDPLQVSADSLAPLGTLLQDPSVEVVFHDADYDVRLLQQDYGWRVTHIFDTRIAAQLLGITSFGLAALLERYLDIKLEKKYQRADWSMRPLTPAMLEYATHDTAHLLALRDRLHTELTNVGRWSWAQEEFDRLEGIQWPNEDHDSAFLKIKGARDLTRRELAILRAIVHWRDVVAQEYDRATFRIVGNEVLLQIAHTQPLTKEALGAIRGMPRGITENRSSGLFDAIRAGQAVPDNELPKFPRAPRWSRDPDFEDRVMRLKAVRDKTAQHLKLDPGVLCSRERLEAIARRQPTSMEDLIAIPDMRRWQAAELGEALLKAL